MNFGKKQTGTETQSTKAPKEKAAGIQSKPIMFEAGAEINQPNAKTEMQIVYLDQNAATFLAKARPGTIWQEIRQALSAGFHDRRLICPLPFEGVWETAPCDLEFRKSIQALFWQLSEGVAFKSYAEISSELTLALIRPVPNWSPWLIWKPIWAEMEGATETVKSDLKSAKLRWMERMKGFVRSPNLEEMSERELFHSVAAQRSGRLCLDLDGLLAARGMGNSSTFNFSWVIEALMSGNWSPAEIEALKRAVQYRGWAQVPIHTFNILLGARWEYDSIRGGTSSYEPNDEIDRMRAAVALSHADLFITEGGMADLCRRARVSDFCPTVVLSVRNPEKVLEALVGTS